MMIDLERYSKMNNTKDYPELLKYVWIVPLIPYASALLSGKGNLSSLEAYIWWIIVDALLLFINQKTRRWFRKTVYAACIQGMLGFLIGLILYNCLILSFDAAVYPNLVIDNGIAIGTVILMILIVLLQQSHKADAVTITQDSAL